MPNPINRNYEDVINKLMLAEQTIEQAQKNLKIINNPEHQQQLMQQALGAVNQAKDILLE